MSAPTDAMPLNERMYELTMRVDKIVHLPTTGGEDMDSDLFEWLTEEAADALAPMLGQEDLNAALNEYGDDNESRTEALTELLVWKNPPGWLLTAAQPIFREMGNAVSYSWGNYRTRVFGGDTYESALDAAMQWAFDNYESAKAIAAAPTEQGTP